MNRPGEDIADRLLRFALNVLWVCRKLPRTPEAQIIRRQLFRSATSTGAQYEEARSAESAADFIHKVRIGAKEMREARYGLKMLHGARFIKEDTATRLLDKPDELLSILLASAHTAAIRREKY